MDHLNTMMFGEDHFHYYYNEKKVCMVAQDCQRNFAYDREQWNEEYTDMISSEATRDVKGNYFNFILNITLKLDTILREKFKNNVIHCSSRCGCHQGSWKQQFKKPRLHNLLSYTHPTLIHYFLLFWMEEKTSNLFFVICRWSWCFS